MSALQQWWSLAGTPAVEQFQQKLRPNSTNSYRPPAVTCFSCGKPGHCASECWGKPPPTPVAVPTTTVQSSQQWTCYRCGQCRHKSPQCPQKSTTRPGTGPPWKTEKTVVRMVSHQPRQRKDTNLVIGWVGCQQVLFVIDTGARISIVPESVVEASQLTGEFAVVTDAFGGSLGGLRRKCGYMWGLCPPDRWWLWLLMRH